MINLNSFPSSMVNISDISCNISELLRSNPIIGGINNQTNKDLTHSLQEYLNKQVVLTNSGTNSLLIAIEYALKVAHHKKIRWIISEYIYFSIASFLMNRTESIVILTATEDEVTLTDNNEINDYDFFNIVILTSHNNKNCTIPESIYKLKEKFIIEDRCLVFGLPSNHTVDVECYSFSNNKLLVAGEGGCIVSQDSEFISWARLRTFNGIIPTRNIPYFMYLGMYQIQDNVSPFKASTTSLSSLLLLEQLRVLPRIIEKRVENYHYLNSKFNFSSEVPDCPLFYSLKLPEHYNFKKIQDFQTKCIRDGVQTMMGVLPYMSFLNKNNTIYKKKKVLSIPVHTELHTEDLDHIAITILKHYEN